MIRVDVFDTLKVEPTRNGKITLEVTGDNTLSAGPENLVVRAAQALQRHAPQGSGARLQLEKIIPQGAGMGGGSSDAAAALVLLSKAWNISIPSNALSEIGATLGSDVPFFLQPHAARGTGRGEILDPVPLQNLPWALLIHPGFGSPTAVAYADYAKNPQPAPPGAPIQLERTDGSILQVIPQNDLEPPVEKRLLWIPAARKWMETQSGILTARMSGSGSTVFGLFANSAKAQDAHKRARDYFGPETWIRVARLISGNLEN